MTRRDSYLSVGIEGMNGADDDDDDDDVVVFSITFQRGKKDFQPHFEPQNKKKKKQYAITYYIQFFRSNEECGPS